MHFTISKLKLQNDDLTNIQLEAFSDNVCCWSTITYMSNVKFVYHLWQNRKTLGCGNAICDPKIQSPYCTHSKYSYEKYSFGNLNYKIFYFLKKMSNLNYLCGNLLNQKVFNIFNVMKGQGYNLLCGKNDSYYILEDAYNNYIIMFHNIEYSNELNKLNAYIVKKYNIKRIFKNTNIIDRIDD